MRVLKIDRDLTVAELDLEIEDWMTEDVEWDAVSLDEQHDLWVLDQGLTDPENTMALIGGKKVPLPAYVTGANGERTVDATMELARLKSLIS